MIKLVASDLDGTLLLHKAQSLPEEIFSLIRQLEELGIMFVAASGRQYPNMTKLFAPVAGVLRNRFHQIGEKTFLHHHRLPEIPYRNLHPVAMWLVPTLSRN